MKPFSRHFWSLISVKIKMNLQAEASRSQLSYLWWILEPLLEATVFYIIFGIFMARGTPDFVVFLLIGLIPWTWFARSTINAMGSLKNASHVLNSFRLHPAFFPLVELGQDAAKQVATFSFLLLFLLVYGIEGHLEWAWLPVLMAMQFLLIIGLGCFLAGIIPFLEDLRYLVATGLTLTMFASGIFYDPNSFLTEEWRQVFFVNPMASMLQIYRDVLLYQESPSWEYVRVVLFWAASLLVVAYLMLSKNRDRYARLITE